jgi:hypothetical protein
MENSMLSEITKLSRTEFDAFIRSGAFTGFTKQDMAEASETDRGKMEVFNEGLRLIAVSKGLNRRRGQ